MTCSLQLTFSSPYQHERITLVTRLPFVDFGPSSSMSGRIACLSEDELMIVRLGDVAKVVPRSLTLGKKPRNVLYSWYLDLLVVTYSQSVPHNTGARGRGSKEEVSRQTGSPEPVSRESVSSLQLVAMNQYVGQRTTRTALADHCVNSGPLPEDSYQIQFKAANDVGSVSPFAKPGERFEAMIGLHYIYPTWLRY